MSGPGTGGLRRREAALIFVLALLPRLAHFWFVRHTPLAGEYVPDLTAYLFAVERLMDSAYFFVQPMLMSPGYALVLAPQYILLGPDIPAFVLVNAVLDAGSAVLCAGLAARVAPAGRERAAGLAAGLLYALCGPLLFYTLLPLGEGPSIFCLLAGLCLLFAAPGGRTLTPWLAGALLALAALIRPNLAPAVLGALAVWCLAPGREPADGRRPRLGAAARCLLGFFLVLSPFMAHNAAVGGRVSPFGFQGGFTLYTGNHPGASGVGDALPGFDNTPYLVNLQAWEKAQEQSGRALSLAEADAWWYARTWRHFADNPGQAAALLGRKALLLLNGQGVDATANQAFCARFSPVPGLLALPVGLVFALAALGFTALALAGPRRAGPEATALAVALLLMAGLIVLFQVTPRYRIVLLPLAIIFAACGLAELPGLLRGGGEAALSRLRRAAPLAAGGLVLALSLIPLGLLVQRPGFEAQEHVRLGRYYLLKGPQALAQEELAAALALGAPEPGRLRAELDASRSLQAQDAETRPAQGGAGTRPAQ